MVRLCLVLTLLAPAAWAGEFDKTLRRLKVDDRERRREALTSLADGTVDPRTPRERAAAELALARFLSRRVLGVERALAVRALGRVDRPQAYQRLLKWMRKERDDRVLAATADVFRAAPIVLEANLVKLISKAKDPAERAIYVRLLGALPGSEARRRTRLRASMAEHWTVRATAAHALARDRDPEALPVLVGALDDLDPAVVTAAIESLTRLTGKKFGRDVGEWKVWWETREETKKIDDALEKAGKGESRTTADTAKGKTIARPYFGIPVRGRRIAFVFDVSASMRYKLPLANDQLTRVVKSLPSTSFFEVVFFNEHVWPWRGRLSHADPVTKAALIDHVDSIDIKSYTNLFDAIELALRLKVEEIFVVSDGEPNRGRRQLPRDILKELKRLAPAAVRIHTVSIVRVVDGDEHIALLEAIAKQHRGEHVQRTLK